MARAKKSLGQHFLIDPEIVSTIIEAIAPGPGVKILEIGPGEGVLTYPLVKSDAEVTAVELDRRLAPELAEAFADRLNFRVYEEDILKVNPSDLGLTDFVLIGNLPYNITTPVIDWLLRYHDYVGKAVFMMQKEVAQRVVSPPKQRARSTITVLTALFYDGEIVCEVPPEAFRPRPRVDSAVIRLTRHGRDYGIENIDRFRKFVRFCFAEKRKSLLNNLVSAYPLNRENLLEIIEEICGRRHARAEELDLETFIRLFDAITERR